MNSDTPTRPYGVEDLETVSLHSAAPTYISEAPSYRSTDRQSEETPPYAARSSQHRPTPTQQSTRQPTEGLPPVPPCTPMTAYSLNSYSVPSWTTLQGPSARHYQNIIDRRASNAGTQNMSSSKVYKVVDTQKVETRPLEDPYLVGETAAAAARRERLAKETGENILIEEDRRWDWFLATMSDWEERERSWDRFRREAYHKKDSKTLHSRFSRFLGLSV